MKLLQWYLLASTLFFLNTITFAQTTCYPNDSLAMMRMYDGLNISYDTMNPAHSWTGVVDTISDPNALGVYYRITNLNLSAQGTLGVLRDSIFEGDSLNYLHTLDLQNNSIASIDGYLRYDASSPAPALQTLTISFNIFNSYSPLFYAYFLANMSNLQKLYANGCTPASLNLNTYTFPNNGLLELHLNYNILQDTLFLDSLFLELPILTTLSLNNNNFTAIKTSSAYPLESFYINNNDISSIKDITDVIENANFLKELYGFSALDNITPDSFIFNIPQHHYNLNVLDLGQNNLYGSIPLDLFEKLDSIKYLSIENNNLTGEFPTPSTVAATGIFAGKRYYEGTGRLQALYLSANDLSGDLPLHWLFAQQFILYPGNNAADMPLAELVCSNNQIQGIAPGLADPIFYQVINNPTLVGRFTNFQFADIAANELDFRDLYRFKKFFNFQQGNFGGDDHYFPLSGADSSSFEYGFQADLGIGGVKRRATGTDVTFDGEVGIVEPFPGGAYYISNNYFWERLDTVGIIGGAPGAPVIQFIGQIYQNGASFSPNLVVANGLSGTDTTYHLGVDLTAENAHKLFVIPVDSPNHARWTYQAKITNDSFPLLDLYTKGKILEVGSCIDGSGQPVHCQSMMVQFKPSQLAGLTQLQQDSVKEALRISLGAKPLESCLCGDMELWEISDTASAMLQGNGSGTKNAATQTSIRPQLLSADPNYDLLGGNNSSIPVSTAPAGSGNSTAKTLVAIIDSGMDFGYTPLRSHLSEGLPMDTSCISDAAWGYNFLNTNNNASDDHGHGTAVASIVAGLNQNNLLPDTGAYAGKLAILPLKYTNNKGKGSLFHAACALRYAADFQRILPNNDTARVRVINASWGFSGDPSPLIDNTLKYVGQNCDILVVCAAGNGGHIIHGADSVRHWPSNSIFDPADTIATDNVLGVGAIPTHSSDALTTYSNFSNKHVDIVAQGNDSTAKAGSINGFVWQEGTSFAAPQVARAAGLLFDKYPEASYFAVKYALTTGVDKLQSTDSTKVKSKGRLNYMKADSILNRITNRALCAENSFTINVNKIDGNNSEDLVNLYPNPVANELNLDFDAILLDKEISLMVFNAQGQSLYAVTLERGTGHYTLSTKDLPTGIYFLQLSTENQQINKRFLKR